MAPKEVVWVECQLSRGGFPSELVFHLPAPDGGEFIGVAPARYCFGADKSPARTDLAPGEKEPGWLLGIALEEIHGSELVRVLLPNNDIYEIGGDRIQLKEDRARVPLESGHPVGN